MGSGPGPHGQVIGLMKCVRKQQLFGTNVAVSFDAVDNLGFFTFLMKAEQAEYYTVGNTYQFQATTP